jgi:2-keto-3-deoxy-L-fuconate dehydrogenase
MCYVRSFNVRGSERAPSMKRLSGKRALVSAAGNGIGRAIHGAFLAEGAESVPLDRDADSLRDFANAIVMDLTDREAVAALPELIGPIDILVNAAGIVHSGTALDCSDADWELAFDLNAGAMFRVIRAFLPGMLARGSGSIVNIASVASGIIGVPNRFAYGASKGAVIGMTKSIAADFVGAGIRCNAICPGTVETPSLIARISEQAARDGISFDECHRAFASRQPIGRLGRTAEIAALAVHLASDESSFTTGTTAIIDGGWTVL